MNYSQPEIRDSRGKAFRGVDRCQAAVLSHSSGSLLLTVTLIEIEQQCISELWCDIWSYPGKSFPSLPISVSLLKVEALCGWYLGAGV